MSIPIFSFLFRSSLELIFITLEPLIFAIVEVFFIVHAIIILSKICICHRYIALVSRFQYLYMQCGSFVCIIHMASFLIFYLTLYIMGTSSQFFLFFLFYQSFPMLEAVLINQGLPWAFLVHHYLSLIFEWSLFFVLSKQQHNVLGSHLSFTLRKCFCL